MAYGMWLTSGREIFTVLATVCAHIKNIPQQDVFKFEMQAVHIIKNLCLVLIQSQSPLTS